DDFLTVRQFGFGLEGVDRDAGEVSDVRRSAGDGVEERRLARIGTTHENDERREARPGLDLAARFDAYPCTRGHALLLKDSPSLSPTSSVPDLRTDGDSAGAASTARTLMALASDRWIASSLPVELRTCSGPPKSPRRRILRVAPSSTPTA